MSKGEDKTKPLSGAQLVKNHDQRRRDNGQVQAYVRVWVKNGNEDLARQRMKDSVKDIVVGPEEVFTEK